MNKPAEHPNKEKETPTKHLTREQRRHQERVGKEAQDTFNTLSKRLLNAILVNEPSSEEFKELVKSTPNKWKLYCKHKGLINDAHLHINKYADKIIKDYNDIKNDTYTTDQQDNQA